MITVKEAANHLSRISTLLEISGESSTKVKRFSFAARNLEDFKGTLSQAIGAARDKKIRGSDQTIIEILIELQEKETSNLLESLTQELSPAFLEILELRGIGAKKAKVLKDEANIRNLDELRAACLDGSLQKIKGFGKKTCESILEKITRFNEQRGRLRLNQAIELCNEFTSALSASGIKTNISGKLYRGSETIKDLLIVVADSDSSAVEKIINDSLSNIGTKIERDSVIAKTENGTSVELKVVDGSKHFETTFIDSCHSKHIELLRERAASLNLEFEAKLASIKGSSLEEFERSVYENLDLAFVPAELREDLSIENLMEIDSENLVRLEDITGIVHAHSHYSDGNNSLKELASCVKDKGFAYLGISEHSQSAAYAGGMSVDDIKRQHEEIDRLNEELAPFVILKGIESDILADGSLDYPDSVLETFDFVIASLHSGLSMPSFEMNERLERAICNPYTTCIGHITTRKLLLREQAEMELSELISLAAENQVALEINANPRRLDLPYAFHQEAIKQGVLLPICPDAHSVAGVDDIAYGVKVARKGGLTPKNIPTAWPAKKAIAYWSKT